MMMMMILCLMDFGRTCRLSKVSSSSTTGTSILSPPPPTLTPTLLLLPQVEDGGGEDVELAGTPLDDARSLL